MADIEKGVKLVPVRVFLHYLPFLMRFEAVLWRSIKDRYASAFWEGVGGGVIFSGAFAEGSPEKSAPFSSFFSSFFCKANLKKFNKPKGSIR